MSKKDYIVIARALSEARADAENSDIMRGVRETSFAIARVLRDENPRFDRDRFLRAAGFTFTEE